MEVAKGAVLTGSECEARQVEEDFCTQVGQVINVVRLEEDLERVNGVGAVALYNNSGAQGIRRQITRLHEAVDRLNG